MTRLNTKAYTTVSIERSMKDVIDSLEIYQG